jgi:predicted permease
VKALAGDVKHALRLYRRTPGASFVVIAVLAISMALVAAFLSLYSDLVLRPEQGFEPGGRIISIGWSDGRNAGGLPHEFIDRIATDMNTLEHVAGAIQQVFAMGPDAKYGLGELVTHDFFPGVRPKLALGRGFTEAEHDEQGEPVVVISDRYWQEHYDGSPDVLGRTLEIARVASPFARPQADAGQDRPPRDFRIVGVMASDFTGLEQVTETGGTTAFWIPVERALSITPAEQREQMRRGMTMRTVARRADGASNQAVQRELAGRFADEEFLTRRAGARFDVFGRIVENVFIQRATERQLRLFLGASVLLALVAAANVSLFLLARAPGRRRELGIRMAVGAPLGRLARQLASEAAVLVLAAVPLGLALSIWLARFLRGLPFLREAQWRDVTLLDWRVLALVGVFLLLVTLLVSLAPILGLRRMGIAASSRQVAARASVAQRIAGTAQVIIAGVLGSAAIAFAWYLGVLLLAYPGYQTDNLYAAPYLMSFNVRMENGQMITEGGKPENAHKRQAFEAIPGIQAVSLAGAVPGVQSPGGGVSVGTVPDPDDPEQPVRVRTLTIDENYVGMLGLKILHGRNVTENDVGGALVNQAFAKRFFGREDVAGEPMPSASRSTRGYIAAEPTHILGVLEDFSFEHPLAEIYPTVFAAEGSAHGGVVLVQSTLPLAAFRQQFQQVARTLELTFSSDVQPLGKARAVILAPDRARGLLTIATAAIVVLVAAFGFYGTQRYLVSAGRREYAIRAALGAGPRALGRLVLKRGLLLGLPGLLLGGLLAFIVVAWLRDDYISRDIPPLAVTAGAVLALLALVLAASIGPARLARRTQPAPLLHED